MVQKLLDANLETREIMSMSTNVRTLSRTTGDQSSVSGEGGAASSPHQCKTSPNKMRMPNVIANTLQHDPSDAGQFSTGVQITEMF